MFAGVRPPATMHGARRREHGVELVHWPARSPPSTTPAAADDDEPLASSAAVARSLRFDTPVRSLRFVAPEAAETRAAIYWAAAAQGRAFYSWCTLVSCQLTALHPPFHAPALSSGPFPFSLTREALPARIAPRSQLSADRAAASDRAVARLSSTRRSAERRRSCWAQWRRLATQAVAWRSWAACRRVGALADALSQVSQRYNTARLLLRTRAALARWRATAAVEAARARRGRKRAGAAGSAGVIAAVEAHAARARRYRALSRSFAALARGRGVRAWCAHQALCARRATMRRLAVHRREARLGAALASSARVCAHTARWQALCTATHRLRLHAHLRLMVRSMAATRDARQQVRTLRALRHVAAATARLESATLRGVLRTLEGSLGRWRWRCAAVRRWRAWARALEGRRRRRHPFQSSIALGVDCTRSPTRSASRQSPTRSASPAPFDLAQWRYGAAFRWDVACSGFAEEAARLKPKPGNLPIARRVPLAPRALSAAGGAAAGERRLWVWL